MLTLPYATCIKPASQVFANCTRSILIVLSKLTELALNCETVLPMNVAQYDKWFKILQPHDHQSICISPVVLFPAWYPQIVPRCLSWYDNMSGAKPVLREEPCVTHVMG